MDEFGGFKRALMKELTEGLPQAAIKELEKQRNEYNEEEVKKNLFFAAIQAGNFKDAHRFLLQDVDPNATDEHGRSGLHMSALGAHQDIFKALLARDADLELGDEGGITPLMCACQKGSDIIVDILLQKDADVTKKNKGQLSAIFYALYNGHVEIAEKLEKKKSSIHDLSEEPIFSIYMKAVTKKWNAVVKFLYERNCDMSYSNRLLVASQAGLCGHTDLLQYFKVNFDDKTKDGRSPLHGAVQNGFHEAVKYMLDNGCDVTENKEIVKLAILSGQFEVLQLLRQRGAPLFDKDENGMTPLQMAVVDGPFELFEYLVEEGCSLEAHEKLGSLALIAASQQKARVLKYLAERNIEIDQGHQNTGETPLLAACQHGPYEVVELLLEIGSNPNVKNRRGVTPALRAAHCKQEEILMLLGDNGADLDIPNRYGETAMLCAARNKSISTIRYLADHGCKLTTKDVNGRTVASYAVKTNNVALLKYLQQKGIFLDEPDAAGMTPLMKAVKNKSIGAIKQLTSTPNLCSVNHRDLNGRTALHIAVSSGQIEVVKLLKDRDADISAPDHKGNTPLLESLKHKKAYEMLSFLIKSGCDMQATNNKLKSAMHYACKQKKNDALLLLLDSKSPFDSPDITGMTPFTTSAKHDSESLAIVLKAMGADVNSRNKGGENAVHMAAKNGSLKLVLCFALFGCEVDQEDYEGTTPLIIACSKNKIDIVDLLIRKGADVKTVTHKGETPVHFACRSASLEIVKLLYEHQAELDKPDLNGVTPIMLAAEKQNEEFLTFLISKNCDLKKTDNSSKTVLHYAVSGGNESAVRFLLTKGADPNALDDSGTSPVLLSIKQNENKIRSLLKNKGGIVTEIFDNESRNAAHFACKTGNVELLKELRGEMSFSSRTSNGDNCLTITCKSGHENVLKLLLEQKRLNMNFKNSQGENALHIAAKNSHLDLIPLLLEGGIRVSEKNNQGNNALHILCQKISSSKLDKVKMLKAQTDEQFEELKQNLGDGPDFMKKPFLKMIEKTKTLPDVLMKKTLRGHCVGKSALKEQLTNLLNRKVNPNDQNNQGKGALHFACTDGSKQIIELLISYGADVNLQDSDGETPIFTAIRNGKEKAVKLLIEKGAKLDAQNKKGQSPFSVAITHNESKVMEILKDNEAPFDPVSTLENQTLGTIFKNRNVEQLSFLMEIGFDGKKTEEGKTLLHCVVLRGDVRILKALTNDEDRRFGFIKDIVNNQNNDGDAPLHLAMAMGRLDIANVLTKIEGCKFDLKNKKGHTILHISAIRNQLAQVQWVFENCTDAFQPELGASEEAPSPLHLAAIKGNLEVFRFLEEKGFDASNECKKGMNCAHYAATSGNWHVLQYLKEKPDQEIFCKRNAAGHTPLQCAVFNGHEKTASLLYEINPSLPECIVHQALALGNQHMVDWVEKRGADLEAIDSQTGETPLRAAASSGNFHLVKRLAKAESLNRTNNHRNTPAQQAAANDYRHILVYFRGHNAQFDVPDKDGDTAISDCAINGHLESMKLLVEYQCDLKHKNAKQRSIVHLACIGSAQKGHLNIVKYAAENDLALDDVDDQGNTGLMYACRQGFKDIADFLLTSGQCNPSKPNTQGSTAAHLAAMAGRSDILDALSQHGAQLDVVDSSGATPLMIAVHRDNLDCVKLLAEKAGIGEGSSRDRLGELAVWASAEVRQEVERLLGVQLQNSQDERSRPNQVGVDIDMQLSAYSDQQENRPYDPQVDSNNPFGYSMFQTEATDLMRIEVASMAGTPSEHESAGHEDEDEQEEEEDGGNESNTDRESNGRDTPRPSPEEEPPVPCQQQ